MKKSYLKTIFGASIVAVSITNSQATPTKKQKKIKVTNSIYKIKDQTDNQEYVSDGSKTEKASSK